MPAESDWHLFTTNTVETTATASEVDSGLIDGTTSLTSEPCSSSDESPTSPDRSPLQHDESPTPPDQSPLRHDESPTSPDHSPLQRDESAVPLDTPVLLDEPAVPPNTPVIEPNAPVIEPNSTTNRVDPPTSVVPEVSVSTPSALPTTTRPSPRLVTKVVANAQHSHAKPGLLNSAPSSGVIPSKSVDASSPPVLVGVKDEPEWMETKGTLKYFRNAFKLGKLSDVIEHWYELEKLLGFQKSVRTSLFL